MENRVNGNNFGVRFVHRWDAQRKSFNLIPVPVPYTENRFIDFFGKKSSNREVETGRNRTSYQNNRGCKAVISVSDSSRYDKRESGSYREFRNSKFYSTGKSDNFLQNLTDKNQNSVKISDFKEKFGEKLNNSIQKAVSRGEFPSLTGNRNENGLIVIVNELNHKISRLDRAIEYLIERFGSMTFPRISEGQNGNREVSVSELGAEFATRANQSVDADTNLNSSQLNQNSAVVNEVIDSAHVVNNLETDAALECPYNSKYLMDCISSLSREILRNLNNFLKFSYTFPEEFTTPILNDKCQNLKELNLKVNNLNSNLLLFITEISCNTYQINDKLFRRRHSINTLNKKSFLNKLNKIIKDPIQIFIEFLDLNFKLFTIEFKIAKQISFYLNRLQKIFQEKSFGKFFEMDFLKSLDKITSIFIRVNLNFVKNFNQKLKSKRKVNLKMSGDNNNFSKHNIVTNSDQIRNFNEFFSCDYKVHVIEFTKNIIARTLRNIILENFPSDRTGFKFNMLLDQFDIEIINNISFILSKKLIDFINNKSIKLNNLIFFKNSIFSSLLKFVRSIISISKSSFFKSSWTIFLRLFSDLLSNGFENKIFLPFSLAKSLIFFLSLFLASCSPNSFRLLTQSLI